MRIPISKTYRAFPELDEYSDEECKSYMRQARSKSPWLRAVTVIVALPLGIIAGVVLIAVIIQVSHALLGSHPSATTARDIATGLALLVGFTSMILLPALCNDLVTHRQIKKVLRSTDCGACGYALFGQIPFQHDDGRTFVRCPECGTLSLIGPGGIDPDALMRAAQRDAEVRQQATSGA